MNHWVMALIAVAIALVVNCFASVLPPARPEPECRWMLCKRSLEPGDVCAHAGEGTHEEAGKFVAEAIAEGTFRPWTSCKVTNGLPATPK